MLGWAIVIIYLIGVFGCLGWAGYTADDEWFLLAFFWPAVLTAMICFGAGSIPVYIGKALRKIKHEKKMVFKPDGKFEKFDEEDLK